MSIITRRDGVLTLLDGAAATHQIDYTQGDFSGDNLADFGAGRVVIRNRGAIVGLRKGDDEVFGISFNVHMRHLTAAGTANALDFIRGTDLGVALTSTGGAGFDGFLVDVKLDIGGESVTYHKCLFNVSLAEGDINSLSFSAEVYGGKTIA